MTSAADVSRLLDNADDEADFDSIRMRCEQLGIDPDRPIITAAAAGYALHRDDLLLAATTSAGFLAGQGATEETIRAVRHAVFSIASNGRESVPSTPDAQHLWHAVILHRLDPQTHLRALARLPIPGEEFSPETKAYRRRLIREPFRIEGAMWLGNAADIASELKDALRTFLDQLAEPHARRFPKELQSWFDVALSGSSREARAKPAAMFRSPTHNWRSERYVSEIEVLCDKLRAGKVKPAAAREAAPDDPTAYEAFREGLRQTIDGANDEILRLMAERMDAAKTVAFEKFLERDSLYKPDRERALLQSVQVTAEESGLPEYIAHDVILLILVASRFAQEGVYDHLATEMGANRQFLTTREQGLDAAVDRNWATLPLVTSPSPQLLLREEQIIDERKIAGRSTTRRALATDPGLVLPEPIVRSMIAGSRGLGAAIRPGDTEALVVIPQDAILDTGHLAQLRVLASFQRAGYPVALGLASARAAHAGKDAAWRGSLDRALDLAGLDRSHLLTYTAASALETAHRRGDLAGLSVADFVATYGYPLRTTAETLLSSVARVATLLHPPGGKPSGQRILIGTLADDGDVCLARALRARGIAGMYLRATTDDAAPISASASQLESMIAAAETGGRTTAAEQRERGGNPDPRFCAVASMVAAVCTSSQHDDLVQRCTAGTRMCTECKVDATAIVGQALEITD